MTGEVSYTVKEILAEQEKRAEERHKQVRSDISTVNGKVDVLGSRVDNLEGDRDKRLGRSVAVGKIAIATGAIATILINIPVAVFYLGGSH
jgi:hypothetical protein